MCEWRGRREMRATTFMLPVPLKRWRRSDTRQRAAKRGSVMLGIRPERVRHCKL